MLQAIAHLVSSFLVVSVLYSAALCLYRLALHPLAKFPGPKLAGATRLYEVYHQVYKSDWLETLVALHARYGKKDILLLDLTKMSEQ